MVLSYTEGVVPPKEADMMRAPLSLHHLMHCRMSESLKQKLPLVSPLAGGHHMDALQDRRPTCGQSPEGS